MKQLGNLFAALSLSTGLYIAKAARLGSHMRLLDSVFRPLAILCCVALLFTLAPAEADTICFLTVLKYWDSRHAEAQNYVINNNAEWQNLWEEVFANQSDKPPLPEIDFTRRTIVAVFQGIQPSNGYEISIQEIVETENSLDVIVKAFAPGKRCVVLGIQTRPLDIVEIEKTEKEVVFHVKHKIRNCG
jgi:hypothetical protein